MPKKLALFIHGLRSNARTWDSLLGFLRANPEVTAAYDLRTFEYETGLVKGASVPRIAETLSTFISTHFSERDDIALVGHSQGGLVARQYITDTLANGHRLPVSRLLTFATPHIGSMVANAGKWIPGAGDQVEGLAIDSDFMLALAKAWGNTKAEERVRTHYVVGAKDKLVTQTSSRGPSWNRDYDVIGGAAHTTAHLPASATDEAVVISRRFLLDRSPLVLPEADHLQPGLTLKLLDKNEAVNRFIFGARRIPLFGRDKEMEQLGDLLDRPDLPFRWHLVHGSGGVGKSRIALEFCLAVRSEWRAGFLIDEADEPDWTRWQPALPTLIVVDYAAKAPDRTGRMLRALAMRGADGGSAALRRPVRVLLLERTNTGAWLDTIVGRTSQSKLVDALRMSPDLALAAVPDPWPLIAFVIEERGVKLPDRSKTLARLAEIDPERRSLYAFFMADAIATGRDVRELDAARLVADVIERERQAFWRPVGAGVKEELLLAFATMTGGLPRSVLAKLGTLDGLLPPWNLDLHPAAFRTMTGHPAAERIAPLEPDIVGEHFVVHTLCNSDFSDTDRARLSDMAWQTGGIGMGQFSIRAHRDVRGSPLLEIIRRPPTQNADARYWFSLHGVDLIIDLGASRLPEAQQLLGDMKTLADAHDAEPALRENWAKAAFNLITDLGASNMPEAQRLHGEMKALANAHDAKPALRENWAMAGVNLITDLGASNMPEALRLLGEMRALTDVHVSEPVLRQEWAKAAVNLITHLRASSMPDALRLHGEMKALADAHDAEPALRENWAMAAHNLLIDLRASSMPEAQRLHGEMKALADAHDAEPALRENWAKAALNLLTDLRASSMPDAQQLHGEMKALADAHDAEPALRENWAKAAFNLITDLRASSMPDAQQLLGEMKALADAHDAEPFQRENWTKAAFNLIYDLRASNMPEAQRLHGEMKALADAHDAEPALRENWAKTAFNLIYDLRASNMPEAQRLLGEMKALANAHDAEPALRENWAKAALNLITDLRASSMPDAQQLLGEMKALADAHDAEPLQRENWTKAAFNLINDLRASNMPEAQRLHGEMKALADAHDAEPALRENWAKTAFNLIYDLRASNMPEAQRLLGEMKALANAHDAEPALRENWAKAALNLLTDLGASSMPDAQQLHGEMKALADAHDTEPALRQEWTKAAFNLIIDLRASSMPEAQRLLGEMKALADAHPEEASLRELMLALG